MRKTFYLLLFVVGCGASEDAPKKPLVLTSYQVRCPLTTVESVTDTVEATGYYYNGGGLSFTRSHNDSFIRSTTIAEFPGTCVVKEITL